MGSMPYPADTSIFIVGGSVFGLSTAYHLTKAGYSNITVLDRADKLPSPFAAGNDLNKVIRAEYGASYCEDDFYTDLALQAIEAWQTPEWSSCFRQVGYIRLARSEKKLAMIDEDFKTFSQQRRSQVSTFELNGADQCLSAPIPSSDRWFPPGSFGRISGSRHLREIVPQLANIDWESEWKGYKNDHAGYALSAKAIAILFERCREIGVKFVLGKQGHVVGLLPISDRREMSVAGVKAIDGSSHEHQPRVPALTIIAIGAHLANLLPAVSSHITAKSWSVAHLELTEEEAWRLAGVPVMNFSELGFWMEPIWMAADGDYEPVASSVSKIRAGDGKYLLKIACHGGGWTNFVELPSSVKASVPPSEVIRQLPPEDEATMRYLVQISLPKTLHDRPFVHKLVCWCADTNDSDYMIDFVPGFDNVVVVGADSGHAMKMMPLVGKWVHNLLETGEQVEQRWRWKQREAEHVADKTKAVAVADTGSVSWRSGEVRDIKDACIPNFVARS